MRYMAMETLIEGTTIPPNALQVIVSAVNSIKRASAVTLQVTAVPQEWIYKCN